MSEHTIMLNKQQAARVDELVLQGLTGNTPEEVIVRLLDESLRHRAYEQSKLRNERR